MNSKTVFFLVLLCFQAVSRAEDTKSVDCLSWAQKASSYMEIRQNAVPIHEAMKQMSGNRSRGMMLRAYHYPVEVDQVAKTKAIDDFKDQIYQECVDQQ